MCQEIMLSGSMTLTTTSQSLLDHKEMEEEGKVRNMAEGNELFQAQGWAEVVEDISQNGA